MNRIMTLDNEEVPCNICSSNEYISIYTDTVCPIVKCNKCGLVYVNPRPNKMKRNEINQESYGSEYRIKQYFVDRIAIKRWSKNKLKIIEKFTKIGRVLDIGCGLAFFLDVAKNRGWETYGVEINGTISRFAKENLGLSVLTADIEHDNLLYPKNFFDVITFWDTLEHLSNPFLVLEKVKHFLKPKGLLCVQLPNFDSFISKCKGKNWDWLTPGDHLYYFSYNTLISLLKKTGFEPLEMYTWEPILYPVNSLLGFYDKNNIIFDIYRKTLLRIIKLVYLLLFYFIQRSLWKRNKGALLVGFFRKIDEKTN